MQHQIGLAARLTDYFYVQPAHSLAPSGAERLEGSFFGCEARRVAFRPILEPLAIGDFFGSVNAPEKALRMPLESSFDTCGFDDIDSGADDHAAPCGRTP